MPGERKRGLKRVRILWKYLLPGGQGECGPVGRRLGADRRGLRAEGVIAEDHTLLALPTGGGQGNGPDPRNVVIDVAAIDGVILLPETPLHLQADLVDRGVGDLVHRRPERVGDRQVEALQHRDWDAADAVISLDRAWTLRPGEEHLDPVRTLTDLLHDGRVTDHPADLTLKALGDMVHAADRLQHGPLLVKIL